MNIVEELQKTQMFSSIPEALLQRLALWFYVRRPAAGDVLISEGESSQEIFVIVSGTVVVAKALGETTEAFVARLEAGMHLGEIDMIDDQSASASATMETAGVVLHLDIVRFRRILVEDRPLFVHVSRALFIDLANKVRQTNDKVRETIEWGMESAGEKR